MTTMSEFFTSGGGAVTGDLRSFNTTVEDTTGWYQNGTQADKTTDATLYAYLNGKSLAADWVDVTTCATPTNVFPVSSSFTPSPENIARNLGVNRLVHTGTYYLYANAATVYYSTLINGPWVALPSNLSVLGNVLGLTWISSLNTLIIFRQNGYITRYDLTSGVATAYEQRIVKTTSNSNFGQVAYNTSLSKLVFVDTQSATPTISAIALDGTGKVNFTNTAAGTPLALSSVAGKTIALHSIAGSSTSVKSAASGTTDFTVTNASTLAVSVSGSSGDIATDGTNIICAYATLSGSDYYVVYHSFNGTTWSTYSTLAINLRTATNGPNVVFFGSRYYFFQGTPSTNYAITTNPAWSITSLGGAPTNLTSSFKIASSRTVIPSVVANGKLFWSYQLNGGTATYNAVCFSTSDNLTTNAFEFQSTLRLGASTYGNVIGINSSGKVYTAYVTSGFSSQLYPGTACILSTTDYATWTLENLFFDVSDQYFTYQVNYVDLDKITCSGNAAYFFIQRFSSGSVTSLIMLKTTDAFATAAAVTIDSSAANTAGARSYSVTDGTFAYLLQAVATFSGNTSLTYRINRITLSSGAYTETWATVQTATAFSSSTDYTANFTNASTTAPQLTFRPSLVLDGTTLYAGYMSSVFDGPTNYQYSYKTVTTAGTVTDTNVTTLSTAIGGYTSLASDANYVYMTTNGISKWLKVANSITAAGIAISDATFRIPDFSNNSYATGRTLSSLTGIGDLYSRALPAQVAGVTLTNNVPLVYINSQLTIVSGTVKAFCNFDPVGSTNFIYRLTQNTTKYGIPAMPTNATGVTPSTAFIKG
jgi:hypothetical protein